MSANLQTSSYTLVTGGAAISGAWTDVDKTLENTVYYKFSGLAADSVGIFTLEARDPAGFGGYIIDTIWLTGQNTTNIATFNTPISNGLRGNIQSITLGGSGYCYLDCSY